MNSTCISAHHIREVVHSFYADIWNRHDKSKIPLLLSDDCTFRGSLGPTKKGHDGFASYLDCIHHALADYRCDIIDLLVESPKAFARLQLSGMHRAEFFGHPPTGKKLEWAGSALFTFKDQRVTDIWVLGDLYGLKRLLENNAGGPKR